MTQAANLAALGTNVDTAGDVSLTTGVSGVLPYANLPAGSVLQVVNVVYGTEIGNNTTTYADSNLTATITPKFSTSKILVMVEHSGVSSPSAAGVNIRLLRGATSITTFATYAGYNASSSADVGSSTTNYLDSPATTSATTYKTQFKLAQGSGSCYMQNGNAASTITLMEIAG